MLHDWRDVDHAIVGLVPWMKRVGYKGEIVLWVLPVPGEPTLI
jgi:hypothetical protein